MSINHIKFWQEDEKKVTIIPILYRDFLTENGFYKYSEKDQTYCEFIKIEGSIIRKVQDDEIKDFTLKYLEIEGHLRVWNHFASESKLWGAGFLSMLNKKQPDFIHDNESESFIFYENGALVISKSGKRLVSYDRLKGHLWNNKIIKRKYVDTLFDESEYRKFIHNISGNVKEKINSIESTIGFLIHTYKPPSYCPAIILNDETISDNPEGGTGKGIFVKGIGHIRNNIGIDCKTFRFDKTFLYQRVSRDTEILTFEDIPRNFDFERLFSVITEGMSIEKKRKDEFFIEFDESPKNIITTNYALRGVGNSHDRRKFEVEFVAHYTKSFTPKDEFGHNLFKDWSQEQWEMFDNYMAHCVQVYLKHDLIKSPFKNLEIRKLEAATSSEFRSWAINEDNMSGTIIMADKMYLGADLMNDFTEQYPDYGRGRRYEIANRVFYRWLEEYGEYRFGMKPLKKRGMNGVEITFVQKELQTKMELK